MFYKNPRIRGFEIVTGYEDVATLPVRGTKGSAGYDFYITRNYDAYLESGESYVFDTGIKAYMPQEEVLLIYIRSSLGIKKNLILSNCVPVIDSDYYNNKDNEGHILLSVTNIGNKTQVIPPKSKIAQGIFTKYFTVDGDNVDTERVGGVGSTGIWTILNLFS